VTYTDDPQLVKQIEQLAPTSGDLLGVAGPVHFVDFRGSATVYVDPVP
jgi:hypothetical protein